MKVVILTVLFSVSAAVSVSMSALALASPGPAAITFTVRNAEGYIKNVARSCLSTPDSKIEVMKADQLLLTDANAECALELRGYADNWESMPRLLKTVSVYATPENKVAVAKKLTDKFGKSFLILPSQACPCLLLRGPRAEEGAAFARR